MPSYAKTAATLALLISLTASQSSGSGKTTRYWDCCKPSCAWPGKGQSSGQVASCDKNDKPLSDPNASSGCQGGTAYMCSSQSPWAVNGNLAYGFTAVSASNPTCCTCYQLTFTSGPISGKKMIVQATNTGTDVASTQFDLAIPGGGFGKYDACTSEWNATSAVWGQQYGGPSTNTCPKFPPALQPGCEFRWDWMQGADDPDVDYEVVSCPAEIVAKSGCGSSSGGAADTTEANSTTTGQGAGQGSGQGAGQGSGQGAGQGAGQGGGQGAGQGGGQGAGQGGGQGAGQGSGQGAGQGAGQGTGQAQPKSAAQKVGIDRTGTTGTEGNTVTGVGAGTGTGGSSGTGNSTVGGTNNACES